ncbi:MAG: hypothetical protein AAGJ52_12090 [Pseudomonadota bacterium]
MLTLKIQLDKDSVSKLMRAGYQIALLADTQSSPLLIACLLNPMQSQTVTWIDGETVYVSTAPFKTGDLITINSSASATAGGQYDYSGGVISSTGTGDDGTIIQLGNSSGATVSGGLGSAFSTSSNSSPDTVAVTGTAVLNNALATFQTSQDYFITAVTGAALGMVIPTSDFSLSKRLNSPISALPLTSLPFSSQAVDCLTVTFNPTSNQFEAPTGC